MFVPQTRPPMPIMQMEVVISHQHKEGVLGKASQQLEKVRPPDVPFRAGTVWRMYADEQDTESGASKAHCKDPWCPVDSKEVIRLKEQRDPVWPMEEGIIPRRVSCRAATQTCSDWSWSRRNLARPTKASGEASPVGLASCG